MEWFKGVILGGDMLGASNRQKKLLKFFEVKFSPSISIGAAGWEIEALLEDEANRDRWHRYLFLTSDFDNDTDDLLPFDERELATVNLPDDWSAREEITRFKEELVASTLADASPFDNPQPPVVFFGKAFIFTGRFTFGSRKSCQSEVIERGGTAPAKKSITSDIDYLVVGAKGSKAWKRGSYGTKIAAAILSRRERGTPAIISEEHWVNSGSIEVQD